MTLYEARKDYHSAEKQRRGRLILLRKPINAFHFTTARLSILVALGDYRKYDEETIAIIVVNIHETSFEWQQYL